MNFKKPLTKLVCTQLGWLTDLKTFQKCYNLIWQNPRDKDQGGMRLTDQGFTIFTEKMEMKSYEIQFPKDLIFTNQVLVWLDRFIDGPYYITKSSIIVFKEKTAVQLILFNGDIQRFGQAKIMSLENNS